MTVGDQVGRIIGAPPGSTVMHQNVAVAEAIVLSCFRPVDPRRNRVVYEEGNFPSVRYLYQAQPELEVVVVEDDQAIVDAIDERTLLVPITHVLFKTAEIQDVERDRPPRARGRRARRARRVPVGRNRSARRRRARTSTSRSAAASSGCAAGPGNGWLYVRPDLAERARADLRRLAGACAAVQLRARARLRRRRARFLTGTPNVPALYAATAGLRPDRGDRRRPHPRELGSPDAAAHRPARRSRLRRRQPARRRPPRRHRHGAHARSSRPCTGSSASGRSSATSAPTPGYGSGRTTTTPTTSFATRSRRSPRSWKPELYERHLGATARF